MYLFYVSNLIELCHCAKQYGGYLAVREINIYGIPVFVKLFSFILLSSQ